MRNHKVNENLNVKFYINLQCKIQVPCEFQKRFNKLIVKIILSRIVKINLHSNFTL